MKNGLCLLASLLLLLAFGLGRLAQVLGGLQKDLLLSPPCRGGEDDDRFRLAKVLFLSEKDPGEEDRDVFFVAEEPGRLEKVVGGFDKALGRLPQGLARLAEAVLLLAK
ncbi:MAG TPA: hypothetical protein VF765_12645 [Polyangiaceae bacterium]